MVSMNTGIGYSQACMRSHFDSVYILQEESTFAMIQMMRMAVVEVVLIL